MKKGLFYSEKSAQCKCLYEKKKNNQEKILTKDVLGDIFLQNELLNNLKISIPDKYFINNLIKKHAELKMKRLLIFIFLLMTIPSDLFCENVLSVNYHAGEQAFGVDEGYFNFKIDITGNFLSSVSSSTGIVDVYTDNIFGIDISPSVTNLHKSEPYLITLPYGTYLRDRNIFVWEDDPIEDDYFANWKVLLHKHSVAPVVPSLELKNYQDVDIFPNKKINSKYFYSTKQKNMTFEFSPVYSSKIALYSYGNRYSYKLISDFDSSTNFSNRKLPNGTDNSLWIKVEDTLGISNDGNKVQFIYDNTSPELIGECVSIFELNTQEPARYTQNLRFKLIDKANSGLSGCGVGVNRKAFFYNNGFLEDNNMVYADIHSISDFDDIATPSTNILKDDNQSNSYYIEIPQIRGELYDNLIIIVEDNLGNPLKVDLSSEQISVPKTVQIIDTIGDPKEPNSMISTELFINEDNVGAEDLYELNYCIALPEGYDDEAVGIKEVKIIDANSSSSESNYKTIYSYEDDVYSEIDKGAIIYGCFDNWDNGNFLDEYKTIDEEKNSVPFKIYVETIWHYLDSEGANYVEKSMGSNNTEDKYLWEIPKPNIELGEYNNLKVLHYRDGIEIDSQEPILFYPKLSNKREIFTNGSTLNIETSYPENYDINGEELKIGIRFANSNDIPSEFFDQVTLTENDFLDGSNYKSIEIVVAEEQLYCSTNFYPIEKLSFSYDSIFSINDYNLNIRYKVGNKIIENGTSIVNCFPNSFFINTDDLTLLNDNDYSGIDNFTVSIGKIEHEILYNEIIVLETDYDESTISNENILISYSDLYNATFGNFPMDGIYKIIFTITDKAGNIATKDTTFTYDSHSVQVPSVLTENPIFSVYDTLQPDNPANITDFDFDTETSNITLQIDTTPDLWEENVEDFTFTYSFSGLEYTAINESNWKTFVIPFADLPEDYRTSNCEITGLLTITDTAGNTSPQETPTNLSFYTPVSFSDTLSTYITETSSGYNSDADEYTMSWEHGTAETVRLYYNPAEEPFGDAITHTDDYSSFTDSGLSAHETRYYLLKGINGSGYESTDVEAFAFSRTVDTTAPVVDVETTNITPVFEADTNTYIGPDTNLKVVTTDTDNDAVFGRLVMDVFGTEHILTQYPEEQMPADGTTYDISAVLQEVLINDEYIPGDEFVLYYEFYDSWSDYEDSTITVDSSAEPQRADLGTYIYDDVEPEITFVPDYLDGYTTSNDGFELEVADSICGMAETTLNIYQIAEDNSLIPYLTQSVTESLDLSLPEYDEYEIVITAEDNLGNEAEKIVKNFCVDTTAPSIDDIEVTGADSGTWYTNKPYIPFNCTWSDGVSGIKEAHIELKQGTEVVGTKEFVFDSAETFHVKSDNLITQAGIDYSIVDEASEVEMYLSLTDYAGNTCNAVKLDTEVFLDMKSPVAVISAPSYFMQYNGKLYLSDNSGLSEPVVNVADANFASSGIWILSGNGTEKSGSFADVINSISADAEYSLVYEAIDLAGNTGTSNSLDFTFDSTAPAITTADVTELDNVHPGDKLRLVYSLEDVSPVADIRLTAGIAGGSGTELTGLIEGNSDGVITDTAVNGAYMLEVPEVVDGTYIVKIAAADVSGNESGYTVLYVLNIDNPDDYVTAESTRDYSNSAYQLSATAEYHGEKEASIYRYRAVELTESGKNPINDWKESTNNFLVCNFASPLNEGSEYVLEVDVQCTDGFWTAPSYSSSTVIDTEAAVIANAESYEYSADGMTAVSWNALDESGVESIEIIIGKYSRDSEGDFVTETIDDVETYVIQNLGVVTVLNEANAVERVIEIPSADSLVDGDRINYSFKVRDLAGNISQRSGGVTIYDASKPVLGYLLDSGDYINPKNGMIDFYIDSSVTDSQSGIAEAEYQILIDDADIDESAWSSFDNFGSINPKITADVSGHEQGTTITLAVRAENNVGLESLAYSNGIIIDTSMPQLSEVVFNQDNGYFSQLEVSVNTSAYDEISNVATLTFQRGTFEGGIWTTSHEEVTIERTEGIDEFNIDLSGSAVGTEEKIWFKLFATDDAENDSLPVYSQGMIYDPSSAIVTELSADYDGDNIRAAWSVSEAGVGFESYNISLTKEDATLYSGTLAAGSSSWSWPVEDEGGYVFNISGINELGETDTYSSAVLVDLSAPSVNDLSVAPYVSEDIEFSCNFTDSLSYVDGWEYRIGMPGEPGIVTDGWISAEGPVSNVNELLEFAMLAGGAEVDDTEHILVEVAAKDKFGNWSTIESGNWSLIDLTAPEVTELIFPKKTIEFDGVDYAVANNYLSRSNAVDNLKLRAIDGESGVSGYRWFVGLASEPMTIPGNPSFVNIESPTSIYSMEGISLKGLTLEDGERYLLYISARNQAGVDSEWSVSEEILADFTNPEAVISLNDAVGYDVDAGNRPVVNSNAVINIEVSDNMGEHIITDITVYDKSNNVIHSESQLTEGGSGTLTTAFEPETESWGIYLVELITRDTADNKTEEPERLYIRFNSPPVVSAPQRLEFNPMRPDTFAAGNWELIEPDGIKSVEYHIYGHETDELLSFSSASEAVEVILAHSASDPRAAETLYTLESTLTDGFDQSKTYTTELAVVNTTAGQLYTDEYWSGTHKITDEVTVPETLTLTILPATEILASKDAGLVIEAGATLTHEGAADYKLNPDSYDGWKGITLYGTGDFNNISISDAVRALVVTSSSVCSGVEDSSFLDNEIGLHLFKPLFNISNSEFNGNKYYGIKEEAGTDPTVTDSTFGNNGWDYYDSDLTVITIETLNGLDGNFGNIATGN